VKRALGVCYYPEHWPQDMWAADAAAMVKAGISWVRIGEFAWSRLEPQPGSYDFDWLDAAIKTLADAGLQIILGTPSATPPRWMLTRFPDMLAADAQGLPRGFGSRRHYCHSHDGYRDAAADMARILGARYGRNPAIAAWQIDNEYGCHDTTISYSPAARDAFRLWLARQYGTIEALNTAWGNVFWSMEYDSFDVIELPYLSVTDLNPSHEMAFRRFASDQVVQWNAAQVAALRPLTDAPLIHNYMGRVLDFDHFAVAADLDIASWDSYPIGFLSDRLEGSQTHKARYLQQGDPDMQAFHHDLYRAMNKGRWWVMEQQPGPVNWAPYNPAPLPGMVRLWSWEAFAHGAEVVSYFRWRQAPFAQEQLHAGLMRPDNAAAPGLDEAARVARELAQMPNVETAQAPVALVFDYAAHMAWDVLPQGADFDYFRLVFDTYKAARRHGLSVDIVPTTTDDMSGYKMVLAPGLPQISDALMQALATCKAACLIGPRSNLVTAELGIPVPMGPAIPGLDTTVTRVESLPPAHRRPVRDGGAFVHWVETLEGSATGHFQTEDGALHVMAKDALWYLGGWPDERLWDRIIHALADQAGVQLHALPEGLRLRDTGKHRFAFNYGPTPVEWNGTTITAADFAYWPQPRP